MKTLFQNIEQVMEHLSISITMDFRTIQPYITQAEQKFIKPILGELLYVALIRYNYLESQISEKNNELLSYIRPALIHYAYLIATPKLNINVGDAGFTVTSSDNLVPAAEWRIRDFQKSMQESGDDAMEFLLYFLETHSENYPLWKHSTAYSFHRQFFVKNAADVLKYTSIDIKRTEFLLLKPFIRIATENVLFGTLGDGLCFRIMKEFQEEKLQTKTEVLIERFLAPFLAYYALGQLQENDLFRTQADTMLAKAIQYIQQNHSDFSEYKITTPIDVNDSLSRIFVFNNH